MCSISGILTGAEIGSVSFCASEAVAKMNSALQHRGPDDSGIFEKRWKGGFNTEGHICIGNTRLSVIDTSAAGHQPMLDTEAGICVSYNGETYNFRELKAEIANEFGPWRSTTDTEVVLRAYRKWGIDGLKKLRGMFALAIWDGRKQELILARDQFGIKPLYYFMTEALGQSTSQLLVFSSEIRALFASGLVPSRLSRTGLASYLTYGSTQAPLTIIDGVKSLMPGECQIVRFEGSRLIVERVSIASDLSLKSPPAFRSRSDAARTLRDKLQQSVRAHMVSDVPLGIFLSGGMDSSALVALVKTFSNKPARTFSVVFDDSNLSEMRHSRAVAATFQTAHSEIKLDEEQLLRILPAALRSFDQPSMDGMNAYVVSRAVKEAGVTVALSGLGGDELFAGYPSFRRALRWSNASIITKGLMHSIGKVAKLGARSSTHRTKFYQLASSDRKPEDIYRITRQLFAPETVIELAGTHFEEPPLNGFGSTDLINRISILEMRGYMTNTLLRDTDNLSMAHSLEVRVPFVDIDVAQFALSLPGRVKLNGDSPHVSKPLLAAAVAELLPEEILQRRKMGFTLPFETWMQSRLRDRIGKTLSDPDLLRLAGLDQHTVAAIWSQFLRAPRAVGWTRPWSLYVLAKWCENNGVRS